MTFLILPIVSLVLYIVGFLQTSLVLYMAVAGLAIAVVSYNRSARLERKTIKYFSLALVVLGVVLLLCGILSIFALGPFLASII